MFGWLNSRSREIRQLNKDAGTIVEMARQTYREPLQRDIAQLTREGIAQVKEICDGDADCLAREIGRFTTLHREARSQHNQVGLTAHTLVIIYLRSLVAGDDCAPAREAIDHYVADRGEP